MNKTQISDLFNIIGINPGYKGYSYLIYIVKLATEYHDKPFPCMKNLYQQAADYFNVPSSAISDNIRTLLRNYWNMGNKDTFSRVLHYPVKDRLTVKEFVAVVAGYLCH